MAMCGLVEASGINLGVCTLRTPTTIINQGAVSAPLSHGVLRQNAEGLNLIMSFRPTEARSRNGVK